MIAQVSENIYEAKTQEIAKEILRLTQEKKRSFFGQLQDQMRWDDKLMDWAMASPGLRVQLFRFIDCLPALRSRPEIARHLQEYLTAQEVELPEALKKLLNFASPDSVPGQLAATTVAPAVETLAHKYISGENIKQVIKTLERLRKDKMGFTVDLLGEAVITETEAQIYLNRYLELMAELANAAKNWPQVDAIDKADGETLPRVQVSVKLTAFYSQFDPLDAKGSEEKVSERIRLLLRRAKELGCCCSFRYGTVCLQKFNSDHSQRLIVRGRVSQSHGYRNYIASIFARQCPRFAKPDFLGKKTRKSGNSAAGKRRLLGSGNYQSDAERLAAAGLQ